MNNAVGWFEIYVDDMSRAKAFYERVLNVVLAKIPSADIDMWAFPMQDGGVGVAGALAHMPGFAAGANSVLVYFMCADCAVEAARAVAAGGKLQKAKSSIGQFGHIALIVDSEGNLIGLHSMQ